MEMIKVSRQQGVPVTVADGKVLLGFDRGEAGLAQALAIECAARLDQGAGVCARQALEAVQVPIGGGSSKLPLARLVPAGQLQDLEDLLANHG